MFRVVGFSRAPGEAPCYACTKLREMQSYKWACTWTCAPVLRLQALYLDLFRPLSEKCRN